MQLNIEKVEPQKIVHGGRNSCLQCSHIICMQYFRKKDNIPEKFRKNYNTLKKCRYNGIIGIRKKDNIDKNTFFGIWKTQQFGIRELSPSDTSQKNISLFVIKRNEQYFLRVNPGAGGKWAIGHQGEGVSNANPFPTPRPFLILFSQLDQTQPLTLLEPKKQTFWFEFV